MSVRPEILAERHPFLYHMAQLGSWPAIERHGLLSTRALLDRFEVKGDARDRLESQHRPDSVEIAHPEHGRAVIRDQKPMSDRALLRCLRDGLTPADWYRILNEKVYFWLDRGRLDGLLAARAYRGRRQTVLTVATAELLARHGERVLLSPINSGSTVYTPQPRGRDTFLPLASYPLEAWERRRGRKHAIVELTVAYAVPDIRDLVVRVEEAGGGQPTTVLWERAR